MIHIDVQSSPDQWEPNPYLLHTLSLLKIIHKQVALIMRALLCTKDFPCLTDILAENTYFGRVAVSALKSAITINKNIFLSCWLKGYKLNIMYARYLITIPQKTAFNF